MSSGWFTYGLFLIQVCAASVLQEEMGFLQYGRMYLPKTDRGIGRGDEIHLKVTGLQHPGQNIFNKLEVLRMSWRSPAQTNKKDSIKALGRKGAKGLNSPAKPAQNTPDQLAAWPERGGAGKPPVAVHNPLVHQQVVATPSWVKNPNFYDPCEVEGVVHIAEECGLTDAYFHG